jgi:ribosomal protein S18 acetylase RimI-like enzyme
MPRCCLSWFVLPTRTTWNAWVPDAGGLRRPRRLEPGLGRQRDDVVIGLLVLKLESDHLLLNNLAVSPNAQGTGIGAQLLDFADSYAREHGRAEVRLYTNEAMTENIAYYPRHGFVETYRATDHGYRRVFFTKHL